MSPPSLQSVALRSVSRGSKKQDRLRIGQILDILLEPYDETGMELLSNEAKLYFSFRPDAFPIFKRRILGKLKITGLWWIHENEFVNWKWQGYHGTIKDGKLLATRSLIPNTFCYIRTGGDRIDIEAQTATTKCSSKGKTGAVEWVTCSINETEYKRIDTLLGPVDNGCRHEGEYDFSFG